MQLGTPNRDRIFMNSLGKCMSCPLGCKVGYVIMMYTFVSRGQIGEWGWRFSLCCQSSVTLTGDCNADLPDLFKLAFV